MGLFSDILEYNRGVSPIDPCMYINASACSADSLELIWKRFCSETAEETEAAEQDRTFSEQVTALQRQDETEKRYLSYHYLLDICIYREKQLLEIQNRNRFATYLVNDAVSDYLSIVRESMSCAIKELSAAKKNLLRLPQYSFSVNDVEEAGIPVRTLVDALFRCLSSTAAFDDSHFLQTLFDDISRLIAIIEPGAAGKKPKTVCREYYERAFHPEFGISRCDNCGNPLYKGCPYCFNCFERS